MPTADDIMAGIDNFEPEFDERESDGNPENPFTTEPEAEEDLDQQDETGVTDERHEVIKAPVTMEEPEIVEEPQTVEEPTVSDSSDY